MTFLGATLCKSTTFHRVHVPSTHSLPAIIGVLNGSPNSHVAEIVIKSCNSGIRQLDRLSPLFTGIWTENRIKHGYGQKRSFQPVSLSFNICRTGLKSITSYISLTPTNPETLCSHWKYPSYGIQLSLEYQNQDVTDHIWL